MNRRNRTGYNYRGYGPPNLLDPVRPGFFKTFNLTVSGTDVAGNTGPGATYRWTVDWQTPITSLVRAPELLSAATTNVRFDWLADEDGPGAATLLIILDHFGPFLAHVSSAVAPQTRRGMFHWGPVPIGC